MNKLKTRNTNNGYRLSVVGCRGNAQTANRKPQTESLTGFSFIELMTVVAIIAILIAASMPMFRNFARGRNLKEGTNIVVSALRKTRNAAITERKMYETVFDTVNNAVAIYKENDVNNPAENWAKLSEFVRFDTEFSWGVSGSWCTGSGGANRLANNYSGDEKIFWIEFKPSGAVGGGVGSIEQKIVLLEESTDDTKLITVNALTGRIKVEE